MPKGKLSKSFGTMKTETSNLKAKTKGKSPIVKPAQQKRIGKK